MGKTVTLEDVRGRTVDDLLNEVARAHEPLRVVLESGDVVTIDSPSPPHTREDNPALKPLSVLPGFVPEGWKDEIYDFSNADA